MLNKSVSKLSSVLFANYNSLDNNPKKLKQFCKEKKLLCYESVYRKNTSVASKPNFQSYNLNFSYLQYELFLGKRARSNSLESDKKILVKNLLTTRKTKFYRFLDIFITFPNSNLKRNKLVKSNIQFVLPVFLHKSFLGKLFISSTNFTFKHILQT